MTGKVSQATAVLMQGSGVTDAVVDAGDVLLWVELEVGQFERVKKGGFTLNLLSTSDGPSGLAIQWVLTHGSGVTDGMVDVLLTAELVVELVVGQSEIVKKEASHPIPCLRPQAK